MSAPKRLSLQDIHGEESRTKTMNMRLKVSAAMTVLLCLFISANFSQAAEAPQWLGQTVYVPVYSHIHLGDKPLTINLAATLSIRNTDLAHPITVTSVKYYDGNGKFIRGYQKDPIVLPFLASKDFFIKESDVAGGIGASFVVEWQSAHPVSAPLIEAVMIGAAGTPLGISFVTRGQVIKGTPK
jgi:hypothetical protein